MLELGDAMELDKLQIDPIYANKLNMDDFAQMLKNPNQSYKFYWFEAIVTLLPEKDVMTFAEIISEMIWQAWYTVTQYHLHLGPIKEGNAENYIEHAIHVLEKSQDTSSVMTKEKFDLLVREHWDEVKADYKGLTIYVPYRLLSSFFKDISGSDKIWDQRSRLITYAEELNKTCILPYIFLPGKGLERKIKVNHYWRQMILDNYSVIRSWIQMKKIRFLQDRNPGVPGIVYKLEDASNKQRNMTKVRTLWMTYSNQTGKPIKDIYSGEEIAADKFSLDHFVPWSYLTSDELWDLTPMDRGENSSKGNKLPDWDHYFPNLLNSQFDLYDQIFSNDTVRKKFELCKANNLNSVWAIEKLYIPGNSFEQFKNILEHYMHPIYDSAVLQGYRIWR